MSLSAHNLFVYRGTRPVLSDVSVEVRPGEVLAIVGPNGAGKSTLLHTLSGTLRARSGDVRLDGRSLARLPPLQVARRRAVLPQHAQLASPFTLRQVVQLGRHPHRTRAATDALAVDHALRTVGLIDRATDPFTQLSGGEQQRVMLARVLAQLAGPSEPARFLLLDEPTSALDLAWQHRALDLVRALANHNVGVLIVLHDLTLAATRADRVALLCRGRLQDIGPPSSVLRPAALHHAFGVQSTWMHTPSAGGFPVVTGTLPNPNP